MEHDVLELFLAISRASAVWKQCCRSYTIDANQRDAFQAGVQEIEACRQSLKDRLVASIVAGLTSIPADQPRGFSTVDGPEVNDLLSQLNFTELDMVMLCSRDPPWPPLDCTACAPFSSSLHARDVAGVDACMEHHKTQLMKLGVQFDGPFSMYNLHRGRAKGEKLYAICPGKDKQYGGTEYCGNVDGCLAPSGLSPSAASCASRIIYMHMQRPSQEEQRQDSRPPQASSSSSSKQRGPGGVPFSGAERGQAVIAMLAAYAYNSYPLMFDLTDGKVHHLLQIHGDSFHTWGSLSPQQAYWKQAQMLLSSPDLADPCLALESIRPDLQEPMRRLRCWRADAAAGLNTAPQ